MLILNTAVCLFSIVRSVRKCPKHSRRKQYAPARTFLRGGLAVLPANLDERGGVEEIVPALGERTPAHELRSALGEVLPRGLLLLEDVILHLVHGGLYLREVRDVDKAVGIEVGNSDGPRRCGS